MVDRPEPNGWELAEGIARIERKLDDQAKGYLAVNLFETVIGQVRAENADLRDEFREMKGEQVDGKKIRAQNLTAVLLGGLAAVVSVIGWFIQR